MERGGAFPWPPQGSLKDCPEGWGLWGVSLTLPQGQRLTLVAGDGEAEVGWGAVCVQALPFPWVGVEVRE